MSFRLRFFILALAPFFVFAQDDVEYSVSSIFNASSGKFAPYMIGSWNHGKNPDKNCALLDAGIKKAIDYGKRFSWGFGIEGLGGYTYKNDYLRWNKDQENWQTHRVGPSKDRIQQLYADIKYRQVFFTVGLKEYDSPLLNNQLSSGDFVQSNNARPIPQVRAGFYDFVSIPFTNNWLQIQGELSVGYSTENNYLKNHYNYYNYHIHTDSRYCYRRCYFRTNPEKPFSVTVGMQVSTFFGGYTEVYNKGTLFETRHCAGGINTFFKIFIPTGENGEEYYTGSSLGSWDLAARYKLKNGNQLILHFQGPWEDGSSIGRLNKFDGLWGLEFKSAKPGIVNGAVFEYLDFRDQCGPVHWAPGDLPGTTVTNEATGMDDYYNNYLYNSYSNYGMSIGTPFLLSPIYNLDGYLAFKCTRANGFHAGVMGNISLPVEYKVLLGYQRGLGTYRQPYPHAKNCFSALLQCGWDAACLLEGLNMTMQCAIDRGALRGNNLGMSLTLTYSGLLK